MLSHLLEFVAFCSNTAPCFNRLLGHSSYIAPRLSRRAGVMTSVQTASWASESRLCRCGGKGCYILLCILPIQSSRLLQLYQGLFAYPIPSKFRRPQVLKSQNPILSRRALYSQDVPLYHNTDSFPNLSRAHKCLKRRRQMVAVGSTLALTLVCAISFSILTRTQQLISFASLWQIGVMWMLDFGKYRWGLFFSNDRSEYTYFTWEGVGQGKWS